MLHGPERHQRHAAHHRAAAPRREHHLLGGDVVADREHHVHGALRPAVRHLRPQGRVHGGVGAALHRGSAVRPVPERGHVLRLPRSGGCRGRRRIVVDDDHRLGRRHAQGPRQVPGDIGVLRRNRQCHRAVHRGGFRAEVDVARVLLAHIASRGMLRGYRVLPSPEQYAQGRDAEECQSDRLSRYTGVVCGHYIPADSDLWWRGLFPLGLAHGDQHVGHRGMRADCVHPDRVESCDSAYATEYVVTQRPYDPET